ncbi:hypothetical protein [Paremcibacter congregatus]|uniref:hypothetical protein n=1 Tax=Paremcibacter congregatus TaxID=2043170 RepID=UPI003A94D30C
MTITAKPIPFSAPMIKALLREIENPGTGKTQTRRIIKPQPMASGFYDGEVRMEKIYMPDSSDPDCYARFSADAVGGGAITEETIRSPYAPGDLLYVRESYFQRGHWEPVNGKKTKGGKQKWEFTPESHEIQFAEPGEYRKARDAKDPFTVTWHKRLGRFMPRRYSRITLEVTDVRVQRLQDISEEDAKAEGVYRDEDRPEEHDYRNNEWMCPKCDGTLVHDDVCPATLGVIHDVDCYECETSKQKFQHLWTSINGPESWDANPWVWVVTFKPHLINVDQFIKERAAA